jgi:hypothetical protein
VLGGTTAEAVAYEVEVRECVPVQPRIRFDSLAIPRRDAERMRDELSR